MARMGGLARAKAHSKAQLRKWGKEGRRPVSLDRMALARLEALLSRGKSQAECAVMLGVSVRTVGRAADRVERGENNRELSDALVEILTGRSRQDPHDESNAIDNSIDCRVWRRATVCWKQSSEEGQLWSSEFSGEAKMIPSTARRSTRHCKPD
jgi:hypothetical protein